MLLTTLCFVAAATATAADVVPSATAITGLWTTLPANSSSSARHDALRVSAAASAEDREEGRPMGGSMDGSMVVSCEHGGSRGMKPLKCPWAEAKISSSSPASGQAIVTVTPPAPLPVRRGVLFATSSNCSWTSAPPGAFWSGASNYPPPFTPSCSRIEFDDGEVWLRLRNIKKVHVLSMSHLDVGYTGSIAYTLNSYFADYFPRAIRVQAELEAWQQQQQQHRQQQPLQSLSSPPVAASAMTAALNYITHPWLVYLYLNCHSLGEEMTTKDLDEPLQCPNATALAAFEQAVRKGTITWHAGPMNMQAEWMDSEIYKFGVNMSHLLDDHFDLPRKRTLSQRDVPGMTRGVVPLLRDLNVTGITVGVNGGVCAPQVPMLFRWRVPASGGGDGGGAAAAAAGNDDDDEVVASWHPGGYPDVYGCPGANNINCTETIAGPLARKECMMTGDEALCFAFRTDNTGPPESAAEVLRGFAVAASQFPGAQTAVVAGSLDDFYAVAQNDTTLPVVTAEVGDVWIPGVASDPWKASTTRRMQRAWAKHVRVEEPASTVKACGCTCSCSGFACGEASKAKGLCGKAASHGITNGEPCSKAQGTLNSLAHGLARLSDCTGTFNTGGETAWPWGHKHYHMTAGYVAAGRELLASGAAAVGKNEQQQQQQQQQAHDDGPLLSPSSTFKSVTKAGAYLLKLTEHTWGLSDLYNKSSNWTNAELQRQIAAGDFDTNIKDWDLQRRFTRFALAALPDKHPLAAEWEAIINRPPPTEPNLAGYQETDQRAFTCDSAATALTITESGALAVGGMRLGEFHYENLGEDVYNITKYPCNVVFGGKKGSAAYAGGKTMHASAAVDAVYYRQPSSSSSSSSSSLATPPSSCDFWVRLRMVGAGDGLPSSAWTRYQLIRDADAQPRAMVTLVVLGKVPTRFNEAAWFGFSSEDEAAGGHWSMTKLGHSVSFDEVVAGGSPGVHAIDVATFTPTTTRGTTVANKQITVDSLDAPVIAPISRGRPPSALLNTQEVPMREGDVNGVAFNLWNNAWSTNYLFYYPWHETDANISYAFHITW